MKENGSRFYRTCKRCSVTRVNTLCTLYERAFQDGDDGARRDLNALIRLASDRGYTEGTALGNGGKTQTEVRAIAWNVSSLLTDEDLARLGLPVKERR